MLPKEFNYFSREWGLLEGMLKEDLNKAVGELSNLECPPTKSDQLRGRIQYIKDILLGAESAARERLR